MASTLLRAAASYTKQPGTLTFSRDGVLQWSPSSSSATASPLTIHDTQIAGLSVSKEGAATIALMVALNAPMKLPNGTTAKSVLLQFTGAPDTALSEREKFKKELANSVVRNRQNASNQANTADGASTPATPGVSSVSVTPSPAVAMSKASTPSRAGTPGGANTPSSGAQGVAPELALRIRILKSNPSLAALHKDVVMSGAMSDAEFWSHPTRAGLERAEAAYEAQARGRNARLADPKPTTNEAGEMRLSITPLLVRDMFEQYPFVARAYAENVPDNLDEAAFWTRYFQSKLYHRLRTSARSAASEHIVRDDDVFDKYLEGEDDELEPRHQYNAHDALLDLGSTAEDHGETGNEKDWTMRAGAERKTLPLMRRFNDHSHRLLDDALGKQEEERRKRRRVVGGVGEEYGPVGSEEPDQTGYYSSIVIDDLEEGRQADRVLLNMQEQQRYFEGRAGRAADQSTGPKSDEELQRILDEAREQLSEWTSDLGEFKVDRKCVEKTMVAMLLNIRSRTENKHGRGKSELPEKVQKQLISCHAATTEFLRQFWAVVAPQPDDLAISNGGVGGGARNNTPAARRAKAARMIASLRKTQDRVASVASAAEEVLPGIGAERVKVALAPTEQAVQKALELFASTFQAQAQLQGR